MLMQSLPSQTASYIQVPDHCDLRTMDALAALFLFINIVFTTPTILINLFVLVAVIQNTELHTPAHILISNLALADLGVGLMAQPIFITSIIINKTDSLKLFIETSVLIFGGISLIGVTLILMDRYIALKLHLRYQVVITTQKVLFLVVSLWISALFLTWPVYILFPEMVKPTGALGATICFTSSIVIYFKMYRIIRRHRNQIRAQTITGNSTEIAQKARAKSITTSFWSQFIFTLCWFPLALLAFLKPRINQSLGQETFLHLFRFSMTLFLSKSIANPLLYCWRVREIKAAILKTSSRLRLMYHSQKHGQCS